MSGLFRRLRRDRHASPDQPGAPAAAGGYTEGHAHEESTAVLEPVESSPEDLDAMVGQPPTTRRRGRLRRRLRHLRRVREVLMRDLGGFVFEVHRSGSDGSGDTVVEAKLRRLAVVDAEIRELEAALDDRRPLVLREAGIGGACPQCGELFGSEARFCWACGTPVAPGAGHVPPLLPPYTATEIAPATGEPATLEATAEPDSPDPATAEQARADQAAAEPATAGEQAAGDDAAGGRAARDAAEPAAGEWPPREDPRP